MSELVLRATKVPVKWVKFWVGVHDDVRAKKKNSPKVTIIFIKN